MAVVLRSREERNRLVEENRALVFWVLRRYLPPHLADDEDVQQSAMLGLIYAADRWDESRGRFSTYAVRCIWGYALDHNQRHRNRNAHRAKATGREYREVSLSDALMQSVALPSAPSAEDAVIPTLPTVDDRLVATIEAVERLPDRHRLALLASLDKGGMRRLAAEWGLTHQRISQLAHEGRDRVRAAVGDDYMMSRSS